MCRQRIYFLPAHFSFNNEVKIMLKMKSIVELKINKNEKNS